MYNVIWWLRDVVVISYLDIDIELTYNCYADMFTISFPYNVKLVNMQLLTCIVIRASSIMYHRGNPIIKTGAFFRSA